ncbi:MAG: TCR/Tet family MFS transporter [Myxococcota bacterium]
MARVPPSRAAFAFVFVTVALDMLALGIMVPVLPKLVVQLEGGDVAAAARITGVFGFAWALMQLLFGPVLGALSDRFGRRPVILLSNLGLGLDYVLMALAPNLAWLFVGRVVSGITAASFSTAGAYVADVTPPEGRAAKFGMLGAAFGLGFVVGPAVGGVLGEVDLRLPFWVAAGMSLLNAGYGLFVLPESLPEEKRAPFSLRIANPFGSMRLLRGHPELLGLAGATCLYYVAHDVLPSTFVLYTDFRYAWTERTVGLVLAAVGICSTIVSATLVGPLVTRLGERNAILAGLSFAAASSVVYGLAPSTGPFLLGIPLGALGGLTSPAMQARMSRRVGAAAQGQLQGALSAVRGVTGMIGPILFTQTFAAAIRPPAALPGAAFLLSAGLLAASFAIAWRVTGEPDGAA